MPMAAVLANGKNLMRIVVPKSLLLTTAQLLHGRLGGLLGRKICHLVSSVSTSICSVFFLGESRARSLEAASNTGILKYS
jgi:hypothetical protein